MRKVKLRHSKSECGCCNAGQGTSEPGWLVEYDRSIALAPSNGLPRTSIQGDCGRTMPMARCRAARRDP